MKPGNSIGKGVGRPGSNLPPFFTVGPDWPFRTPLWTHQFTFPFPYFPGVIRNSLAFYDHSTNLQNVLLLHVLFLVLGIPFTVFLVWKIPDHPSQLSLTATSTVNSSLTTSYLFPHLSYSYPPPAPENPNRQTWPSCRRKLILSGTFVHLFKYFIECLLF